MARSGKSRKLNLKVLILCEGQTERNYLLEIKSLLPREKQRGIRIDVEGFKRNDPLNLVNEAIRRKQKARNEGASYDRIWVVFDHDNQPNRDKAFLKAESNTINIAYSSLNIEFWFLLHFQYSSRSFTNGDDLKDFLRQFIKDYAPGKMRLMPFLGDRFEDAEANAERLQIARQVDIDEGTPVWDLNPYVTIHKLVRFIIELKY